MAVLPRGRPRLIAGVLLGCAGAALWALADPDPPSWAYVLYATHPTIVQRVAMTEAWSRRAKHSYSAARGGTGG